MLKMGLPMPAVKHAMTRDGLDPDVMDGDHSKPAAGGGGVPLKEDPKYTKYFKMVGAHCAHCSPAVRLLSLLPPHC